MHFWPHRFYWECMKKAFPLKSLWHVQDTKIESLMGGIFPYYPGRGSFEGDDLKIC